MSKTSSAALKEAWYPNIIDRVVSVNNNIIARVLISSLFLVAAVMKSIKVSAVSGYMESKGIPGILIYPLITFEFIIVVSLVFNKYIRTISYLASAFCLISAVIFHNDLSNSTQMYMALKNISIAGAFLLLASVFPDK